MVPQVKAADLSSVKVVSLYESILDTDATTLENTLAETGTEVVYRAHFRWGQDEQWYGKDLYSRLAHTISEIKARLPWVHVMGAITCEAFVDGDWWPNGTVVSVEAKRQMLWTLPNGTMPRSPHDPSRSYVLDMSKPLARQFVLEYAYKFIDAGFDSLWFDEIQVVPWWSRWTYGLKVSEEPYMQTWKQIASAVKDYSRSKYGTDLLVSLNNGWVNAKGEMNSWYGSPIPDPWPYQDFISIGVSLKTVKTQSMQDDWAGYKAQIKKVYGRLPPIMVFLDWGKPPTPLSIFGNLPLEQQIRMLKLLHETALREGMMFVYPLHGGVISNYLSPPYEYVVYDALKQGTYDTIRQLTSSLVKVYSQTSTLTSTLTLTTTLTESRTIEVKVPDEITTSLVLLPTVVVAAVVLLAVIVLRRRR